MLGWSRRRTDYYLHDQPMPIKRKGSKTVCVKFIINEEEELVPSASTASPFAGIVSEKDESEKAVITGVYLKFLQNDFPYEDVKVFLGRVFQPPDYLKFDENSIDHGTITILCPPLMHGLTEEGEASIYKPVLKLDDLYRYAGLEEKFFKPCMFRNDLAADDKDFEEQIRDDGLFSEDHPIIQFIITYKNDFKISVADFSSQAIDGKKYYNVSPEVIDRIRVYFKASIFSRIHYTRFEDTRVTTNQKGLKVSDKGIVVLLQINYIVVNKNNTPL